MEQVQFFYEAIDRNAVVVIPKKPYFDWANNVFDDNRQIRLKLLVKFLIIRF
jgi:hypothetical protein